MDYHVRFRVDSRKYVVKLDRKPFQEKDIKISTADGFLFIEARHEERQENDCFVSRHFLRKFKLPADCNEKEMTYEHTDDGFLTVTVPRSHNVWSNPASRKSSCKCCKCGTRVEGGKCACFSDSNKTNKCQCSVDTPCGNKTCNICAPSNKVVTI